MTLQGNRRSRNTIAQGMAVAATIAVAVWLGLNLDRNLTRLGIAFGFRFLGDRASFDIGEAVIAYSPANTYTRAIVVGLLNSLRVSAAGIILATLLGTIVGSARLSNNWLARTLARTYVEILRNTPLLLQLLFWYFVAFVRGDVVALPGRMLSVPAPFLTPAAPFWLAGGALGGIAGAIAPSLIPSNRSQSGVRHWLGLGIGVAVGGAIAGVFTGQWPLAAGSRTMFALNLELFFLTPFGLAAPSLHVPGRWPLWLAALVAAITACAYFWQRLPRPRWLAGLGTLVLLVAILAIATGDAPFLEIPHLDPDRANRTLGGLILSPEFSALLVGLTLYTAAFIAEIVRAGLESVPRGQWEAARALGLKPLLVLRLVVFPQALRAIVPPLTGEYLNLWKNSSLAAVVGYPDLYFVASTTFNQTGRAVEVMLLLGLAYLSISLAIAAAANWVNRTIARTA